MSRLPKQLQPAWPLLKRAHRLTTRGVGAVTRPTSRWAGPRAVPAIGSATSVETARLEPGTVRRHVVGPGEQLRRPLPVGEPADHWMFRWRSRYDVPERFVLEMADGTIIGNYAAHVTRGGILDYQTSDYFGVSGWREHPLYLRPRLPEPEEFEGDLLSLATRGSTANYYHFVTDVLPRWGIYQDAMPGRVPDAAYVNATTGYQRQLLSMLGLDHLTKIEPAKHRAIRATNLIVPGLPNPDLMAPSWTTRWLADRLPPQQTTDLPRRIYVTRGQARNTRRLVNEDLHLETMRRHGFVLIDPGKHTVQEQIDLFAHAEAIVAPHGAGLTNLVFSRPGVRVLELFAPNYVNPCYWTIADNIPDVRYRYLVGRGRAPRPMSEMNGVLVDIDVPPAAFTEALEQLLA